MQDIRTIFPIDQYVPPPHGYRSANPCLSVFKDTQADWVPLYSVALKKLVSELPSMSEKELAEAGELGALATLVSQPFKASGEVSWALTVHHIHRLRVPYMLRTILHHPGRK